MTTNTTIHEVFAIYPLPYGVSEVQSNQPMRIGFDYNMDPIVADLTDGMVVYEQQSRNHYRLTWVEGGRYRGCNSYRWRQMPLETA